MKNKVFFAMLLLFTSIATYGQKTGDKGKPPKDTIVVATTSTNSSSPQNFIPPSPNAADLGKFAAVEVGLFTGTAQYSIPIYTFSTPNLSLPIALNYSSNGLKVDELSSWVGYNWTLNVGGIINRFKKGLVDMPGYRPVFPDWGSMTLEQRYNFCSSVLSGVNDVEPDIFIYNFLNYSGKFAFDESGKPRLIPFTKLKIQTNSTGSYTYFNITAPDGVIYKFTEIETTSPISEPSFSTSWYLTKIIHPAGDSVTFSYDRAWIRQYSGTIQTVSMVVASSGTSDRQVCPSPSNTENVIYADNSVLFLKEIDFHKYGKITFEKTADRLDADGEYRLNKIIIKDLYSNQVKAFRFWYQFPFRNYLFSGGDAINGIFDTNTGKHNYRMFLDSVQFLNENNIKVYSYKFSYNDLMDLPSRFCYSQDHWGYFNGKFNSEFVQLSAVPPYPTSYRSFFQSAISSNCNRNADFNYSKKGMLQKIIFPTGGFTEIEYEAHKNNNGIQIGGCRVLRTKSYESTSSTPLIKKYVYPNSVSSFDTVYFKAYTTNWNYVVSPSVYNGSCTIGTLSSNSVYDLYIDGKYHVIYPSVEIYEGENGENGKSIQNFEYNYDSPGTPINGQQISPPVKSNSGFENGLKILSENYDKTVSKKLKESISYNKSEIRNYKKIRCMTISKRPHEEGILADPNYLLQFYDVIPYDLNSNWYYIRTTEQTNYDSGGNVIQTTNYFYDDSVHAQLTSETLTNSIGQTIQKKYYYPDSYGNYFSNLKNNYLIAKPIDTRTYVNNQLVSGEQIKYNDYGQTTDVYQAEIGSNVSDIPFQSTNPYLFTHKLNFQYDGLKNIKQISPDNNFNTTFLWSYNSTYPVAKIENATYSQISGILGSSFISSLAVSTDQVTINTYLSQLRNTLSSSLKDAFVSTYAYKPMVGMISETDPAGRTTYYEYDGFGRLKLVRDQENNIVKKLDYHFANQGGILE